MRKNKKIIDQCISVLMLVIYLFSSLSIISYHNHNEDHYDHYQDSPFCKNIDSNSVKNYDCSHESNIVITKESCAICDHFSNYEAEKLDVSINTSLESFTLKKIQSFTSLDLINGNNTQNKSPPFII